MNGVVDTSGLRQRGFTLIEVLAALAIVALGMLGVIEAVSQTASNSTYMREKTLAHWIAMNRLAEVRLSQRPPEVDKTDGEVEFAGDDWRWSMEVTQTPVRTLRRIDIRVRREGAPESSSLAMVTGFHGQALAPAGTTSQRADFGALPVPDGPGRDGDRGDGRDRDDDNNNGDNNPGPAPEPDPPIDDGGGDTGGETGGEE